MNTLHRCAALTSSVAMPGVIAHTHLAARCGNGTRVAIKIDSSRKLDAALHESQAVLRFDSDTPRRYDDSRDGAVSVRRESGLRPVVIRAIFFAMGVSAALGGVSLLPVESVIVKEQPDIPALRVPALLTRERTDGSREFVPAPWLPMTMLTAGGLTVLYSIALPRKGHD